MGWDWIDWAFHMLGYALIAVIVLCLGFGLALGWLIFH